MERNKKNNSLLHSHINELDGAVYGNNVYGQNAHDEQKYSSYSNKYPNYPMSTSYDRNYSDPLHSSNTYSSYNIPTSPSYSTSYVPPTKTFESAIYSTVNKSPAPVSPGHNLNSPKTFSAQPSRTFDYTSSPSPSYDQKYRSFDLKPQSSTDGYSSSEYSTNTYKTPSGFKTESYKYETYKSADPIYQTIEEKYYTSTPNKDQSLPSKSTYESIKNGTDTQYQSSFSSNVEYINEPPALKDMDTLEQKMLKKSITQQIVEKKTVSTTRTSKQESSTKTFGFK